MLLIVEPNPAVTSKPMVFIARQYLVPFVKIGYTNMFKGRNCGIIGNLKKVITTNMSLAMSRKYMYFVRGVPHYSTVCSKRFLDGNAYLWHNYNLKHSLCLVATETAS